MVGREMGSATKRDFYNRVPTVGFDRRVSEHTMIGRALWQGILWLETHHPDMATRLGFLVLIVVNKPA